MKRFISGLFILLALVAFTSTTQAADIVSDMTELVVTVEMEELSAPVVTIQAYSDSKSEKQTIFSKTYFETSQNSDWFSIDYTKPIDGYRNSSYNSTYISDRLLC